MDLGEHIELHGFVEDEFGEIIIAKKLIGNHVKKLMEEMPGYERLSLSLIKTQGVFVLDGALRANNALHTAQGTDENVFFALDKCLKALRESVE
jgi:hypothetical protein